MLHVKVLITGAAGQVGRAVSKSAPSGVEAVAVAHGELDIADKEAVADCLERLAPDVIINAAAYTAVDRAESEPEVAEQVNARGPEHLAASAARRGARLVHLSTDFVFDGQSSTPYRPGSPAHPLSVYGRTKRDGELAVLQRLPERAVVLRTAWVYAAEGRNFLRTMLRLMGAGGAVRVVCDQVGTPTAADSVARAIWGIVADGGIRGIHHWTDCGVASWYDFAVAIAEEGAILGMVPQNVSVTPIATSEYPTAARRPPFSVLDRSSLVALGLAPIHWRSALREVLKELRELRSA